MPLVASEPLLLVFFISCQWLLSLIAPAPVVTFSPFPPFLSEPLGGELVWSLTQQVPINSLQE